MMEKRITAILVQSTLVHHGIALHGFDYSRILADIFIFFLIGVNFNHCAIQTLFQPLFSIIIYNRQSVSPLLIQCGCGINVFYGVVGWLLKPV